ncbi:hypothetical protein [Haloferax sp. Atlit-4N]|uniref:hypothetical protein n=1 Tax=Haloferax sp. Atlit-4N TaxID=2077206 RepID=UPI0013149023|nr:hypothetical protein [Haloferax sp. Atlit-4N]
MGNPSPVGEGSSFDGSDDFGETDYSTVNNEFSVFLLAKSDTFPISARTFNMGDPVNAKNAWGLKVGDGEIGFGVADGSDASFANISNVSGWVACVCKAKAGDYTSIKDWNGNTSFNDSAVDFTTAPTYPLCVGKRSDFGQYQNCDVAMAAYWSRTLTDSETDSLLDTTARRVSYL